MWCTFILYGKATIAFFKLQQITNSHCQNAYLASAQQGRLSFTHFLVSVDQAISRGIMRRDVIFICELW